MSDVVWYPNQIDGRSNIAAARRLGARVVTTYLDLIAYDIPRYHGSPEAWQAYRSLQRRIALSVDGITTISADVADAAAGGGAAPGARAGAAAAAGPRPHHRASRRPSEPGDGPRGPREVVGGQAVRRRARQRLPAQEPRLRDPGVGGAPCRRASRATSSSPACT